MTDIAQLRAALDQIDRYKLESSSLNPNLLIAIAALRELLTIREAATDTQYAFGLGPLSGGPVLRDAMPNGDT